MINQVLKDIDNEECYYVGTNGCLYQDLEKEKLQAIKQEIKRLNQYIDFYKDLDEKQNKELQNLKQANEEHKKINGELRVENERLNNIINKAIDFLKENACIDEDVEYFCDDLRYDDCKKLLEILKGDDKE